MQSESPASVRNRLQREAASNSTTPTTILVSAFNDKFLRNLVRETFDDTCFKVPFTRDDVMEVTIHNNTFFRFLPEHADSMLDFVGRLARFIVKGANGRQGSTQDLPIIIPMDVIALEWSGNPILPHLTLANFSEDNPLQKLETTSFEALLALFHAIRIAVNKYARWAANKILISVSRGFESETNFGHFWSYSTEFILARERPNLMKSREEERGRMRYFGTYQPAPMDSRMGMCFKLLIQLAFVHENNKFITKLIIQINPCSLWRILLPPMFLKATRLLLRVFFSSLIPGTLPTKLCIAITTGGALSWNCVIGTRYRFSLMSR
ncbi:hypothetical protein DFJ43DRAFT_1087683 [Lentinula guzmanii]|uniref:Uncharacterized protein n=1 Tax=Lentinula guzmanii TaxID=2804957 RepID=A0AA38JER0_9AGAR|nr:hypothetical protein DFJ43DRAFT_1087683 [Lentinula guzmanii]